jgi:hypothetical protein
MCGLLLSIAARVNKREKLVPWKHEKLDGTGKKRYASLFMILHIYFLKCGISSIGRALSLDKGKRLYQGSNPTCRLNHWVVEEPSLPGSTQGG